jgi:hypothetical protein
MDCLRSFNFALANQSNYTVVQGFKYWQIGTQHFWLFQSGSVDSIFNIEGFKNINIYKIEICGDINSDNLPVGVSGIVQNWNYEFQVIGQNSLIGGNVSAAPNGFGMSVQAINPIFQLSKMKTSIEFPTPIQSARQIIINSLYVDGIANESILSIQLETFITVTVYYKFEGE